MRPPRRSLCAGVCSLGVALFLGVVAAAADPSADDVQDAYLLTATRPVLIRLHLRQDGESFAVVWTRQLIATFRQADRDGSGDVDDAEYADARFETLLPYRRSVAGDMLQDRSSFLDVDVRPADGRISLAELIEAFGEDGVTVSDKSASRTANGEVDPLVTFLDRDGTAGVSLADASSARDVFARLDTNDDEYLTVGELQPNRDPRGAAGSPRGEEIPHDGNLRAPRHDTTPDDIAQSLLAAYERHSSGPFAPASLTNDELRISAEEFDSVDRDGSGDASRAELAGWAQARRPDVDFLVERTITDDATGDKLTLLHVGPGVAAERTMTKNGLECILITNEFLQIELAIARTVGLAQSLDRDRQQFRNADADKNGYLDRRENGENGFGRETFAAADRDRNGQLSEVELMEYQVAWRGCDASRCNIWATESGGTFLEMLDEDSDNRLSPREMDQLATRLPDWDRNRDGQVAWAELPREYRISIGPAVRGRGITYSVTLRGDSPTNVIPVQNGAGPEWFHRMDRNSDGDVSRREFVGPLEMFDRADVDDDGLLSPEEAASLDKR